MALLADPFVLAAAIVAVVILGLAKGGFAGLGALATPIMALVLPPATAVALLLPLLLAQDVVSVWSFRKSWDRWIVGWMLPGAALGVGMGWLFADQVDEAMLLAALGAITLVFGLYRLWVERRGRLVAASQSPGWVGSLFGVATGLTSQIAHAGGPPFQMWVTPRRLAHTTYVGTSSVLFAAINWLKVPSYVALGGLNRETLTAAALLLPLAVGSTLVAVRIIRRMETDGFYRLVYWLMVLLGGKLLWDGLAG